MAPSKPSFLILDYPLPGSEITRLLGRFVFDYNLPFNRSAPEDLPAFISDYMRQYNKQTSASVTIQSTKSSTIRAKLEKALSLTAAQNSSLQYDITTARIKTYRLHDQDRAFDALIAIPSVRQEVDALFRRPNQRTRTIYIVVRIKTFLDAAVKSKQGRGATNSGEATAPVGAILSAAGIAPPIGMKVRADWQRGANSCLTLDAKHEGEQIFAVEYRTVKLSIFDMLRGSGAGPRFGNTRTFAWGEGVMGASSRDSEESDSEDDNIDRLPALKSSHLGNAGVILWETE
ncbi:hypothetical protein FOVG_15187 [Fusarium oxysporum f. sp. pisi HDV247]|uniref:Uncharacterized protein n=1 Tax=Fusarium oxysporum f. sp. pisi HDV247 TaxID=1080344 RepID=W9NT68_FUSOX|nr:hypothetical protein FOVG_15187 [Fusarium oxysporum f. sp. pisi HDV247]